MKTAYLFTGQGFQYEGMLERLPKCLMTNHMLQRASDILKTDVLRLDSKEALNNNQNAQLCIYIYEVILGSLQLEKLVPDYVAGHSIGTFSAATISGALEFSDGLKLVSARGKAMEATYPSGYGMMAVTGLTVEVLEQCLKEFKKKSKEKSEIYIGSINSREQIVLSGLVDILKEMDYYLKSSYPINTQFLSVSVPSHCELMLDVSNILDMKMEGITLKQPKIPYIMNTTARRTRQVEMIKRDLIYGVSKTVCWYDIISILYELEVRQCLEIGGQNVLTEIGRKCYDDVLWKSITLGIV